MHELMSFEPYCLTLAIMLLDIRLASAHTDVLKTRAGSVVHWNQSEITIGLEKGSQTISDDIAISAIAQASELWNAVPAGQPRFRLLDTPPFDVALRFCKGRWHGNAIDLGNTQFTASSHDGRVSAASVELNECDHTFHANGENGPNRFDLQSVAAHELGHVLGLGHADVPTAMMFPTSGGAKMRRIHADDQTALALIYYGRASDLVQSLPNTPSPVGVRNAEHRQDAPPADSVSVLSFSASGRQVMVYTCEPTLLPPITEIPTVKAQKRPANRQARPTAR
jgi:hypothetical protein